MIIDIYVLLFLVNFFLFFVGLTDIIRLQRGTRMTIMFISGILWFVLALVSFNLENVFCSYSTEWLCTTESINDYSLAILNIGFGALSILYILSESLGWLEKPKPKKEE